MNEFMDFYKFSYFRCLLKCATAPHFLKVWIFHWLSPKWMALDESPDKLSILELLHALEMKVESESASLDNLSVDHIMQMSHLVMMSNNNNNTDISSRSWPYPRGQIILVIQVSSGNMSTILQMIVCNCFMSIGSFVNLLSFFY